MTVRWRKPVSVRRMNCVCVRGADRQMFMHVMAADRLWWATAKKNTASDPAIGKSPHGRDGRARKCRSHWRLSSSRRLKSISMQRRRWEARARGAHALLAANTFLTRESIKHTKTHVQSLNCVTYMALCKHYHCNFRSVSACARRCFCLVKCANVSMLAANKVSFSFQ